MTSLPIGDFIDLVERAYVNRGGLQGQRPALKTKTAITIRDRLVSDLRNGAVVPPVVIGVHCLDDGKLNAFRNANAIKGVIDAIKDLPHDSISIIDGMQRTTAFLEAGHDNKQFFETVQRFEFWVSDNLGSLIYRMLVLNTGQVPWEIARQLETIYSQFLQKLRADLGPGVEIFLRDDERRRRDAAQYQASVIVRLFLSFASRKMEFDLKDRVAEDFARIDTVEASSHEEFFDLFVGAMKMLVDLDRAFTRATSAQTPGAVRIPDGRSIFQSYPALVGFIVAVAIQLFDEPGFRVDWSKAQPKFDELRNQLAALIDKMNGLRPADLADFLALDVLNERLAVRSGQVGRFEREVFFKAFSSMLRNAERLEDLQPCWLA